MTQDETGQDELDDLRGDFARMILDEAGKALARDPSLPLSAALVAAVDRQAAEAARISQERIPTADVLAASVLETIRPELIRIAQVAARGETDRLTKPSGGIDMKLVIGIGVAMIAAILLFGAGFMTSRMLPAKAAPAEDAAAATLPPDAGTAADGVPVGQEEAGSQASPVQVVQPEKKAEAAPAGTRAAQAQAATRPVVRQPAPASTPRQASPNPAAANSTSAGTTSAAPPVAPAAPAGR